MVGDRAGHAERPHVGVDEGAREGEDVTEKVLGSVERGVEDVEDEALDGLDEVVTRLLHAAAQQQ